MRKLLGHGTPQGLEGTQADAAALQIMLWDAPPCALAKRLRALWQVRPSLGSDYSTLLSAG